MKFRAFLIGAMTLLAVQVPGAATHGQSPKFKESVEVDARTRHALGGITLTFSGPVGLPGVSLAPGSYIFRQPTQNVWQVSSINGQPYRMFITVPTERAQVDDGYSVVLKRSPVPEAPQRIVALFAPGERIGSEFVYHN